MDLFEYQAQDLFAAHGVPVLAGGVADDARGGARRRRASSAAPVVVKAQVKTGGRGKAGGVKLAHDPRRGRRDAPATSSAWTSRATPSTACWSPQARDIAEEYYFSYLLDRANRTYLAMASQGGRHGDRAARRRAARGAGPRPGRRARPASTRPRPREIVDAGRLPAPRSRDQVADVARQAVGRLRRRGRHAGRGQPAGQDRRTAQVVALDGKVTLDENADFRHPDHAALADAAAADPLEAAAKEKDLNYVKLDGEVGIIGNGAGPGHEHPRRRRVRRRGVRRRRSRRTSSTSAAAPRAEVMANGLEIILGDPEVQSVFVNVFGGITACDAVANGIVQALRAARAARRRR